MNVKARHTKGIWIVLVCLLLSSWHGLQAQQYQFDIVSSKEEKKIIKNYLKKNTFADSTQLFREINQLKANLQKAGYWNVVINKTTLKNRVCELNLTLGKAVVWALLDVSSVPPEVLSSINYQAKDFQGQFDYKELVDLQDKILVYAENNGFPFATTQITSFQADSNGIKAQLTYESGLAIGFDSLSIVGDLKIKKNFLYKYLGIKKGALYSQQKVKNIDKLLQRFPFLRLQKATSTTFKAPKAFINIYANQQKANQIDGIIGILPNELEPQKILFTGQFDLKLRNLFQRAINLEAAYQRLRPTSEMLDLQYYHPAFLGASIDAQINIDLLREDTAFLNINRRLTFLYNLGVNKRISAFVNRKTSQLGFTPLQNTTELPNAAEINFTSYGLGYDWHTLDNYYYPKNGWRFGGYALVGNKEIIKNPALNSELYEGVADKSLQIELKASLSYFWQWKKRQVLATQLSGAWLNNDNIFINDLFRLGGLQSLRGFNQNFFFASTYALATIENRILLDEQSYFLIFYDQAFYEQKTLQNFIADTPLGIGAGISFTTKTGVFNFVYAVGKDQNQPLDFNRSKVHFGFVSRF